MVRPGHHDGAPGAPPWCARGTTMMRPGHHHGAPGAPPWCARGTTLVRPGHHVGAPGAPSWCTDGTIVLHQLRGVHHFPLPPKELTRHLPLCFQQGFQCLSRLPVFSRHPDFPTEAPRWCSGHRLGALDTVLVPWTPSWCAPDTFLIWPRHHPPLPQDTILVPQGTICVHRWHHRAAPTEGGSPLPPSP